MRTRKVVLKFLDSAAKGGQSPNRVGERQSPSSNDVPLRRPRSGVSDRTTSVPSVRRMIAKGCSPIMKNALTDTDISRVTDTDISRVNVRYGPLATPHELFSKCVAHNHAATKTSPHTPHLHTHTLSFPHTPLYPPGHTKKHSLGPAVAMLARLSIRRSLRLLARPVHSGRAPPTAPPCPSPRSGDGTTGGDPCAWATQPLCARPKMPPYVPGAVEHEHGHGHGHRPTFPPYVPGAVEHEHGHAHAHTHAHAPTCHQPCTPPCGDWPCALQR